MVPSPALIVWSHLHACFSTLSDSYLFGLLLLNFVLELIHHIRAFFGKYFFPEIIFILHITL